ncbi:MAG: hypothetical protein LBE12_10290 [Planctomycetaceae bacterium]|jgi:hypothetical protein|nr:hypothetical protein [Planctomycetaceae bacterium]
MTSHSKNQFSVNRQQRLLCLLFLGLVFLAFVGQGLAQNKDETERKPFFSYFQKKKPADSSGNSLFPFSWFRNKDTTPQNNSDFKKTSTDSETSHNSQKSEQDFQTLDTFSSNDLNIAPLPPENPYYEKNRTSTVTTTTTAIKPDAYPISIADSVTLPDLDTVPSSAQYDTQSVTPNSNYSEEPLLTGLSSYSFDTRDWVESFPVDHVSDSSSQKSLPSNRLASAGNQHVLPEYESKQTVASNIPVLPQNITEIDSKQWDGKAIPITDTKVIETTLDETKSTQLASSNRSVLEHRSRTHDYRTQEKKFQEKEFDAVLSGIDLTPSYTTRLKYSEVYGVVVVQSNFPLFEIKSILDEIKQLQIDLNLYMGIPAPKEKIELCLFRDEKTYLKFLQEVFPKAPRDRRALYIKIDDKPGTLLVQKTDEFEIDLRHEMTHAIIHTSIATVPIWLDEGLAKYFEVPIKDRAEKNPYMKQIRWNTKFGAVPSLHRLEKLEHIGQMGDREYRDSWAWVHFLIHYSPQSHRLLAGYIQLLSTLPAEPTENTKNHNPVPIPSISLYLDEVVKGSREKYREHFQNYTTHTK